MNKLSLSIALGTLAIFGSGGILIIELLQDQSFVEVLWRGYPLVYQLAIGMVSGMVSAGIALFLISQAFFFREKAFYYGLISSLNLSPFGMLVLSLCAGIGEELFFRAGIQPFLGIWWTAILFVFIHGYLNPRNWRISVYGVVMVMIIAGFGYLFETAGIFAAIIAHAVFDFILFKNVARENKPEVLSGGVGLFKNC